MKSIFSIMFIWCCILSGAASAQTLNIKAMQGLGNPKYHSIKSQKLFQTYHLFVRLPADFDAKKKYPTVYLLDGGLTFPLLSGYYHYLRFTDELPKMILVGISYGSDNFKTGNSRGRDYTAKSKERDFWGGAGAFEDVLSQQIMPLVEKHYPADSAKRVIFGQSLGGQFVLYSAMTNPGMFAGYIASNPALHRNLEFFLQDAATGGKTVGKSKLFVSDGSDDDPVFRGPALKWMKHWENKTKRPWQLKTTTLEGQSHMSAAPDAFRLGIQWILMDNKP